VRLSTENTVFRALSTLVVEAPPSNCMGKRVTMSVNEHVYDTHIYKDGHVIDKVRYLTLNDVCRYV